MPNEIVFNGMLALQRVLRRERNFKLLAAGITLCIGLGLSMAAHWGEERLWALFVGLSMVAFFIVLRMLRDILVERNFEDNVLVRLLHENPRLFVWMYIVDVQFMPAGIQLRNTSILIFRLTNRAEFQVRGKATDILEIEAALKLMLPHATFGFTKEREQWYIASPFLLWQDDVD